MASESELSPNKTDLQQHIEGGYRELPFLARSVEYMALVAAGVSMINVGVNIEQSDTLGIFLNSAMGIGAIALRDYMKIVRHGLGARQQG